jgi:serine/threonine protein kinase
MSSPFVLNLKYSFHDPKNLYLVFDMALGGDLRFHLRSAARENKEFPLERARFYAAEVFLGLEHIHSFDIVYRDLKPHNVLLDMEGHVKISDLGLAVQLRSDKIIKHLAGTAGYWAPEVIMKTGTYKVSDYWSFGAFLYEMISGQIPSCKCTKKSMEWCPFGHDREHEEKALKEEGILRLEVDYNSKFTPEARDLLEKLFVVEPHLRLGSGGPHEIKEHAFFKSIDWQRLEALDIKPPFQPDEYTVYAESVATVGDHNSKKHKKVTLEAKDDEIYEKLIWVSEDCVQEELLAALEKLDNPPKEGIVQKQPQQQEHPCCCGVM